MPDQPRIYEKHEGIMAQAATISIAFSLFDVQRQNKTWRK